MYYRDTYFEHVLSEQILIFFSVLAVHCFAECWEVDEPIPRHLVCQVQNLLLQRV